MENREPRPTHQSADQIIELIRAHPGFGGEQGDPGALVMYGGFLRAFRRYVQIRELARNDAGEEAFILTRTLLSIVARSLWVDLPQDPAERDKRFARYKKRQLQDELNEAADLVEAGVPIDIDLDQLRADLAELANLPGFPSDSKILRSLEMGIYYARVYRPGSGYVHFSLRQAIDELRSGEEEVTLERPEPELADDALRLATLTFGLFLELADRRVQHGVGAQVLDIVRASPAFELG